MSALVGRNGAGKTNILQAVEWLARVVTGDSTDLNHRELESGKMSAEFTLGGTSYWYSIDRAVNHSLDEQDEINVSRTFEEELSAVIDGQHQPLMKRDGEFVTLFENAQHVLVSDETSAVYSLLAILPKTDALRMTLLRIWGFFVDVTYYPLNDSCRPEDVTLILGSDYKQWDSKAWRGKATTAQTAVMRIIKLCNEDEGTFDELKSLLGEDQLGLISDITVVSVPTGRNEPKAEKSNNVAYFVEFTPYGHTASFSFDRLSFGTKRIVQLIVSMLADRASIALIEQPEDGIHPALLHKLIPLLRAYATDSQVVIASHAPAVLNRFEPSEIRIVEMAAGRTYARSLSDVEMNAAQNYLAKEGPLSDFVELL